ncbi:MAG: aminotransferase class I/II-fold pyridoxal phosphate-dependent enzyme [candidate division Zixibacteria bacterium]|nr:aminotransferase class I/II-fold pyridoxal phosphate-dependent enzyme [candidate division Zixibacteria bacterium]
MNPTMKTLLRLVNEHEQFVDRKCIQLYPATNLMSKKVRGLLSSTIGSRPAEGEPGEKYQAGMTYIDAIERLAHQLLQDLFRARGSEFRALSGSMANALVLNALTQPGDTLLALPLVAGGHISHHGIGVAGYRGLRTMEINFNEQSMNIDCESLRELARKYHPRLIILGQSLCLFPPPFEEIREIASETEAVFLYDGAHVSGLIAGKAFPNPLEYGFSFLTSSSYKTLPGPPGGFILSNQEGLLQRVKRAAFPGFTANYHCNRVAALAAACVEMLQFGEAYTAQIVKNSKALAGNLDKLGFNLLGKEFGFTETHQVALNVSEIGGGARCVRLLEEANILCNKNLIPGDSPRQAKNPMGLRMGTQEVTRLGMKETEMTLIANMIAAVLLKQVDPVRAKKEVEALRSSFQKIFFC